MKSSVRIVTMILLLLLQLLALHRSSASSSSIRGGNFLKDRRNNEAKNLRVLMQDNKDNQEEGKEEEEDDSKTKQDKDATDAPSAIPSDMQDNKDNQEEGKEEEEDDSKTKQDKDATDAPSAIPSDIPSDAPSTAPTKMPSLPPTDAPVTSNPTIAPSKAPAEPPLVIESDSNITDSDDPVIGDVEVVYSESDTNFTGNATEIVDDDEEPLLDDAIIEEDSMENVTDIATMDRSPAPAATPTSSATFVNATETPTDAAAEEMMPCYWRFLTGETCTAQSLGDVVNAYHHQYLRSDGDCHYNEFLGFYRARCEGETEDDPARIWLKDVFCTDKSCGNCLDQGIVRPDIYNSHNCNYIRVNDVSRNTQFDFAFEFVGGCFDNEACARMAVAGHGK